MKKYETFAYRSSTYSVLKEQGNLESITNIFRKADIVKQAGYQKQYQDSSMIQERIWANAWESIINFMTFSLIIKSAFQPSTIFNE